METDTSPFCSILSLPPDLCQGLSFTAVYTTGVFSGRNSPKQWGVVSPTERSPTSLFWGKWSIFFFDIHLLVGGLVAIFDFPINIGFLIIPIDEL